METRQEAGSPVFAMLLVVCLGGMVLAQAGSFVLLLAMGHARVSAVILLGAAVACLIGWMILLMRYLLNWRRDPRLRFGSSRKRWTAVLLPTTAVLVVLSALTD